MEHIPNLLCTTRQLAPAALSTIKKCHMQCWWWYDMRVVCFSHHHFTIIIVILWTSPYSREELFLCYTQNNNNRDIEKNIMTTQQFIISYISRQWRYFFAIMKKNLHTDNNGTQKRGRDKNPFSPYVIPFSRRNETIGEN